MNLHGRGIFAALLTICVATMFGCNGSNTSRADASNGTPQRAADAAGNSSTPQQAADADGNGSASPAPTEADGAPLDPTLALLQDREVLQPQLAAADDDGSLLLVWMEPADGRGADLFAARRDDGGAFGPPVHVNDMPGSVGGGTLDETRPAVAVGANGDIAIAWTTRGDGVSDIRVALSRDGGASFEPSVVLNSDAGARAYRGFVDVDVDAAGVAHAAWIDGRFAPRGAEEPAELFYARVEEGGADPASGETGPGVTEINLTEDQEDSICGCCRVDVDVRPDDRLVIAFRNTGGGYRDIFRIAADPDRAFGAPGRLGPPMWELQGCPVSGALNVGEATLWLEASTGKRRLLAATETGGPHEVVLEDQEAWAIERPPRLVAGSPPDAPLVLLPGRPAGVLLRGSGTEWTAAAEGLPRWAMSAGVVDGELLLLGALDGEVQAERRALDF